MLDVGCGEGALLQVLLNDTQFTHLAGLDIDAKALVMANAACKPTRADFEFLRVSPVQVDLFQGSLNVADQRCKSHDAIVSLEVIEHLHPSELAAFPETIFGLYNPLLVIISTPNIEYNTHFSDLKFGTPDKPLRHEDHKFEWTRAEFQEW